MNRMIVALAFLAWAGHARRMQSKPLEDSMQSLATLLSSSPAAAFTPASAVGGSARSVSHPTVANRMLQPSMMARAKAVAKKAVAKKVVAKKAAPKKVVKKVSSKKAAKKLAPKKMAPKKAAPKKAAPKKVARKVSGGFSPLNLAGFTTGAAADLVGRSDTSWVDVFDPQGLGYFDPAGFTIGKTEKEVLAYREAELKHGRISMLAALGFVVQEKFHPLFGGDIDTPSAYALLDDRIWDKVPAAGLAAILTTLFGLEVVSSLSVFNQQSKNGQETFGLPDDYVPGDIFKPLGGTFDPLGLAPSDPVEFEVMQTKELNNGRLAMLAILGMFLQEVKTGAPLFA